MAPPIPGTRPMYYNPALCLVSVQGVVLGHFADGGIAFEYVTPERRTSEVGLGGEVHVVRDNDPRMRVKLTFKRVCPAAYTLRALALACDAQEDAGGPLGTFRFQFQESAVLGANGNGDMCDSPVAYFESVPAGSFEKTEGELEFVIALPNGRAEFIPGVSLSTMLGFNELQPTTAGA